MAEPQPITIQLTHKEILDFWGQVDTFSGQGPKGTCWQWKGSTRRHGYGRIMIRGRTFVASRIAYLLYYGKDPAPLFVCHRCDNPPCVNPLHLFTDTSKGNSEDMVKKGRAAYGLRNGKYTHPEKRHCGDNHPARKHPEKMARGEKNGNSKLTERIVRKIRDLYATGEWSSRKLGRKFHLDKSTVLDIVAGRIWKHVPPSNNVESMQTVMADRPSGSHSRRCRPYDSVR